MSLFLTLMSFFFAILGCCVFLRKPVPLLRELANVCWCAYNKYRLILSLAILLYLESDGNALHMHLYLFYSGLVKPHRSCATNRFEQEVGGTFQANIQTFMPEMAVRRTIFLNDMMHILD